MHQYNRYATEARQEPYILGSRSRLRHEESRIEVLFSFHVAYPYVQPG